MNDPDKAFAEKRVVSHLVKKLDLSRKQVSDFLKEYTQLAVSQIKEFGSFTVPEIGEIHRKDYEPRTFYVRGKRRDLPPRSRIKMRFHEDFWEAICGEPNQESGDDLED